jgi:hypothetical protein
VDDGQNGDRGMRDGGDLVPELSEFPEFSDFPEFPEFHLQTGSHRGRR